MPIFQSIDYNVHSSDQDGSKLLIRPLHLEDGPRLALLGFGPSHDEDQGAGPVLDAHDTHELIGLLQELVDRMDAA